MWERWIIRIILVCTILFVLEQQAHFSNISGFVTQIEIASANDFINHGFNQFEFEKAKLEEVENEYRYDVTAILLHWERIEGVRKTFQFFVNCQLFKQIIIWNNNPQINLTLHHFTNKTFSKTFIQIINSKKNLKDLSKYIACSKAKTRACLYVDDDWNIFHYIKSLISSFRSDPNVLHSVTDSYTFYTNLQWTYFDSFINLHTGFSWIGCGSVFLRQHAEKHLEFINKYLVNHTELIGMSDIFFSLWLNDIPTQINTNIRPQLSPSANQSASFSKTSQFPYLQSKSSILAIRILEHSLRSNRSNENLGFSRKENRRFPYYIKSSSLNDDLIFYTNILPFPIQNISFNISRDFARGTRRNLPRGSDVLHFTNYGTLKAVDGKNSTCWETNRMINSDDFFSIDFLHIKTNVTFILTIAHKIEVQRELDIRISFDGIRWISYRSFNGVFIKKKKKEKLHTFLFDSSRFSRGFRSYRYISFKAKNNFRQRFQVCEIKMLSKKITDDMTRDFKKFVHS